MWQGVHNIIHNLLWEIFWRVFVIAIVCLFQLKVHPRMYPVTETELKTQYKHPRMDSCIPAWAVVVLVVFVPLFCIFIEFSRTKDYVDTIQAMLAWTLALSITALITESLKLMVGRPRPDFFYRCYPNGNMNSGLICTGNTQDIMEGRKSFPSGHSSFAFCSLGFLSIWMYGKINMFSILRGNRYLALTCITPLLVAGIVAWSRHYDNHHHWEDIIVGSLLGLACSYFSYCRYYYPLTSQHCGEPLTTMTEAELLQSYHMECCTRSFNDDLQLFLNLSSKNSLEIR